MCKPRTHLYRRGQIRALTILIGVLVVATASPAVADTENGNLPGGTSLAVAINSPADGAVLPEGAVAVNGAASIGTGQPVANTALVTVIDVSGSTSDSGGGCGTKLACEKVAAIVLNNQSAAAGTVGEVGGVVFGQVADTFDVGPSAGNQLVTGPGTDANSNATTDMTEVINSVATGGVGQFTAKNVGLNTNFADALSKTVIVLNAMTKPNKIVAFFSDGVATVGGSIAGPLASVPAGTKIFTFAVGTGSSCASTGQNGEGSLQQIANATGGTCTNVTDPNTLSGVVPGVIASMLTSLSLKVDAQAPVAITNVTPTLVQNGPANVTYNAVTGILAPGPHTLCVIANGSDGGGTGNLVDCHTITINARPTVSAGGPFSGQEGSNVAIAGTVNDPDGPSLTTVWTVVPVSGVDPGTTCSFANAAAVSTTVKCTDDGVFALTLTANDGVNPAVVSTATLTLSNVAPTVSISGPANGATFTRGTNVVFTAPFSDVATNDTHTCTWNFDDGTSVANGTVAETNGAGSCTTNHAFTALGAHNVLVTVADDDGGSATAVVKVVIYLKAEAFAVSATGPVNLTRTPDALCPPGFNPSLSSVTVNATGAVSANGLNAACSFDASNGNTTARASVDTADVLTGLVRLTNVRADCAAGAAGITRSSSVGTMNGASIGSAPANLNLGLVQVYLNETATGPGGVLIQNAVRVFKPAVTVLGVTVPAQEIILGSCRLG